MSVLPDFAHHRPRSIEEALEQVSFDNPPYAGGTELLLAMRSGLYRPDALVDLKRIDGLHLIQERGESIQIGGSATHQQTIDSPVVQSSLPLAVEVLQKVGNPRVRAAGTLGGNLCFAEPKSDVATLLDALEASVELRSSRGSRIVPVKDLIVGPYSTLKGEDEILTWISIPKRGDRPAVYSKYQTMERPTIGVAAAITSGQTCRVVVGAVGGKPEAFEAGGPSEVDVEAIAANIEVIPDMTGSDSYKRHIVRVYVSRVLKQLESAA